MSKRIYVEDYVSRIGVRNMLKYYHKHQGQDYRWEEKVTKSPRSKDGISGGQMNKIMIDQALEQMPKMERACCRGRWILKVPRYKILDMLKLSSSQYYAYCDSAVEHIYTHINGEKIGTKSLLETILKED
ncbi:hypothetical protein CIL05_12740 [Virgibacillus profundi]|uniref:Phage protein n=1 Tax=Virgibacillus profundi TaxID=2024555 RepID=A0A2A2ICA6_9BACI|nr:hypothetical protein [Virgibacillus profundi]PAV29257.1 hypothetical protein CIL05_12740 [Virgibacillus profundi]PXY53426.1 hypothetical protein CIT14_12865 [Virgibacillus profundi]